jgi:PAS domain S-box-containing protein
VNLQQSKTILLVEDETTTAIIETAALKKYGYQVHCAENGTRALEILRTTSKIDLILMDIELGEDINGPDTARAILASYDVPIVFLSSHTEPKIVELTEQISSYGYVVKNSTITVLDAAIKMALKLFEAKRELAISEAKQKAMIANIADVIAITGLDGLMKYLSPNIEKYFGWKPEDLLGTSCWLTVRIDDMEDIQNEFLSLVVDYGATSTMRYHYKCKDGRYKRIELTASNCLKDTNINGILMNYREIPEN